jgi:hypothetical protein
MGERTGGAAVTAKPGRKLRDDERTHAASHQASVDHITAEMKAGPPAERSRGPLTLEERQERVEVERRARAQSIAEIAGCMGPSSLSRQQRIEQEAHEAALHYIRRERRGED